MNNETKIAQCFDGIVDIQRAIVGLQSKQESIGQRILESDNITAVIGGQGMIRLPASRHEMKTALVSSGLVGDPLTPSMTPAIDPGTRRTLSIRDLLPSFSTENGAIEVPIVSSKTNNAGPQVAGSPELTQNGTKPESEYVFSTSFTPVETLAHFVPVSAQILEDAGSLDSTIRGELAYGLQLGIEDQLLNGDGSIGQLTGLLAGATAYALASPNRTNEIDILRAAILQVQAADFNPSAILLNPSDWLDIELRKVGTSDDRYAAGDPKNGGGTLWDLPIVLSNYISAGTFLVGDFARAASLFEKGGASVEISRHDASNFQKNMLTLLAEERLALVVVNSAALVTGSL